MLFQTHYLFVQRHFHSLINTHGIFNKKPFFLMHLLTALKAGQVQVASFNWFITFFLCSPSQGLCCSEDCTPRNTTFLCLNSTECANTSYCEYPLHNCVPSGIFQIHVVAKFCSESLPMIRLSCLCVFVIISCCWEDVLFTLTPAIFNIIRLTSRGVYQL